MLQRKARECSEKLRELLMSECFKRRHRARAEAFTRKRILNFQTVMTLLLRRSVKSLQSRLNEWFSGQAVSVSTSAFCQARMNVKHSAFIELHEEAVVKVMYGSGDHETLDRMRVLAIDSSFLRLPDTPELREHFGYVRHLNGVHREPTGQVEAKMSVLYDLLNNIPISCELDKARTSDYLLGEPHMGHLQPGDLLLADRGFGSFRVFASVLARGAHFAIRIKEKNYAGIHQLTSGRKQPKDVVVEIPARKKEPGLPHSLTVRFLRIKLSSGETEILATSLLDTERYPYKMFRKLYRRRWGIETYFHTLKSRLSIDNFSGRSVESVYQDVHSTILVSGMETLFTQDAERELSRKKTKYQQKVNKAISFHVLKHEILRLILERPPGFEQMINALFLSTPTVVRPKRGRIRRKTRKCGTDRRSLYFQRYARKHAY